MSRHPAVLFVALVLTILLGLVACQRGRSGASREQNEPSTASAPAASDTTAAATRESSRRAVEQVFAVEGMYCATCPITVRLAAERIKGVKKARVSMEEARAWITYDPSVTDSQAIARAITDAGYPAKPAAEAAVN